MSSQLGFATPLAALAAPAILIPVAAVLVQARRQREALAALELEPPPLAGRALVAIAAGAAAGLLVLAATQPQLVRSHSRLVRTDAELFVVLDNSRSMAAAASPRAPTRFDRADRFAVLLRHALPEIPTGVASFTDRVLPHLLPSNDLATFDATVRQTIGIDRPPPGTHSPVATALPLLMELPAGGAYGHVRKRLLVLLTDGESQTYSAADVTRSLRLSRTRLLLVRFWSLRDRVFAHGADAGYRPAPESTAPLDRLGAESVGGRVFGPNDVAAVAAAARGFFGPGPSKAIGATTHETALAPWLAIGALLPLGLVLGRRGGAARGRSRLSPAGTRAWQSP